MSKICLAEIILIWNQCFMLKPRGWGIENDQVKKKWEGKKKVSTFKLSTYNQ